MATLIILPGWNSQTDRWLALVRLLESGGIKVRLLKLPEDKVRNVAQFAQWVERKTGKLPSFYLMGHSFGGQVAINFAARFPGRVKKLILINSAGVRRPSWKRRLIAPLAKLFRGWVSEAAKSAIYRLILDSDYYQAKPLMRQTMAIILNEDQQANMGRIKTPTLIIWGRYDRLTPVRDGRLTHKLINGSVWTEFNGRHGLPFTCPGLLAKKILWFIG